MPVFVGVLLALWCCSIAAENIGPAEEGCECLDYDNVQDSHCDANVFPGWAQEYEITAAGTSAELTCYAQHPCLSQDVVIVWHVTTGGDTMEEEGGGSYRTNSDLGQLHLTRGLSISAHCLNFYCHSMLLIPALAVNNHTRVWCGAYTKVCSSNEQNPAPPITVIVEGSLPGPPRNVTVTDLNSTHLQLSWLPPPPPHMPPLIHYSVHVNDFTGDVTDYATTRSVLVVPRPGGSLEFHVGACNAAGEGEASSVAYRRETLHDIILGEAASALCFRCDFHADSQAQGCHVDIWNKRNGEVEQSFTLSRKSLLMTCARGLRMDRTEYMVIAREIEVSGRIGTEVIRHWDPLLLPPFPPPLSPSSTTEAALTNESSSENLSSSEDQLPSGNTLHSGEPSPSGEPSLTDENGGTSKNKFVEFISSWFGYYTSAEEEERAAHSTPHPSLEEAVVRDEAQGEVEDTDDPVFRTEDGGTVEDSLPIVFPTSEEPVVGEKDKNEEEFTFRKGPVTAEDAPPIVYPTSEEPLVGVEGGYEEQGAEPPSREDEFGEEGILPTVSPTLKEPIDQEEEEGIGTQVKVEDALPSESPTSEEPRSGGENRDEEEGAEQMSRDGDGEEEQGTEEPVFRKEEEVGEEGTPPNVLLTSDESMDEVEEEDKDQGTEESVSRKDKFWVEGALPTVSPTSEEPRVGGENKGEEEGAEQMASDRDGEKSTEKPVFSEDEVGEEGAQPVTSPTAEEPFVAGVEDREEEQGAKEHVSRKGDLGEEGDLPTVSPMSEDHMVRDGDQEEEEGVGKQVKVEDALPSVSPTLEEPRVGGENKDEEEGAEQMTRGGDGEEEKSTEEPVFRKDEFGEEGAQPVTCPTAEEPMVTGVEDRGEERGTEEPVSRKSGFREEGALPTMSPTSEDHMVRDGDQKDKEGAEKQIKVEDAMPSVSPTSEEPRVGDDNRDEEEGVELMVGDKEKDEEQGTGEPVIRKEEEVGEEGTPPDVPLTLDKSMDGVEEEDKDQGTKESVSRKDMFREEDDLPTVSQISEEPIIGDEDEEREKSTEELMFGNRDELDEEELIVRSKPILSPSTKGHTAGSEGKDKKEDQKGMVKDEDGEQEGTLSSSSEESVVESKAKVNEADKATTYASPHDQLERPTALLLIVGVVLLGVLVAMVIVSVTRRRITDAHAPESHSTSSQCPPTVHEPIPPVITPHQPPVQEQMHTLEFLEQLELSPASREILPPQLTYYRDFRKKFRYKIRN